MSKSCLVSGGAGFIGSHLCEDLIKKGYQVIVIDNFSSGLKSNVEKLMENSRFTLVNTDLTQKLPEVVKDAEIDYIFHLASPASPSKKSPISYLNHPLETMDVNSIGTRRLLRLARKKKAKFLLASTSEVYGDPKQHPQSEDYWGYVNPVGIRACYDEAKRFAETLTMVYHHRFEVDTRIVRIFNTYGPKMNPQDGRAIVNFCIQAIKNEPMTVYGKGKQTRSFCYVSDLVNGLKRAMFENDTNGEIINLGNPTEITILDLANKIKRAIKSKSKLIYSDLPADDPVKRKPDINKAKKLLKWQPKIKMSQGLDKTIAYFRKVIEDED